MYFCADNYAMPVAIYFAYILSATRDIAGMIIGDRFHLRY